MDWLWNWWLASARLGEAILLACVCPPRHPAAPVEPDIPCGDHDLFA